MAQNLNFREDVDQVLQNLQGLVGIVRPHQGWARTIRQALGMTARQLAERMGSKASRVFEIEKAEIRGAVTVKTLQKTAEAMGCEFIYAFIPKVSLENLIQAQAEKAAEKKLRPVMKTMSLEDQAPKPTDAKKQRDKLVWRLMEKPPRWLWDEQ